MNTAMRGTPDYSKYRLITQVKKMYLKEFVFKYNMQIVKICRANARQQKKYPQMIL